jgi:hypothetical protein
MVHYEDGILTIKVKTKAPLDRIARWQETLSQTLRAFPLKNESSTQLDVYAWQFFGVISGNEKAGKLTVEKWKFTVKLSDAPTTEALKDALIYVAFRAAIERIISDIEYENLFEMLYLMGLPDYEEPIELFEEPETEA